MGKGRNSTSSTSSAVFDTSSTSSGHHDSNHVGRSDYYGGDNYSFTLSNGSVTAASITLSSGAVVSMPLNTGISYAVSGSDIIATRTTTQTTDAWTYRDTDADGFYEVVATTQINTAAPTVNMLGFVQREQLQITQSGGVVSGVTQINPLGTSSVLLSSTVSSSTTSWSLQSGLLVETKTNSSGTTQWEVFRDGNSDGTYTEVAHGTGAMISLTGVITATDAVVSSL